MNYPKVSIIILNWNGWNDTIECLESLYEINYPNYNVIVVDNASEDKSIEKIKDYCKGKMNISSKFFKYNSNNKPVEIFEISENGAKKSKFLEINEYEKLNPNRRIILIKNKDNYGFAGGNNVGIEFALGVLNPDYVLLLNNDTVVDEDFLIEMVKVGESDKKIGIVGSKIYYYDYNGRNDVIWGLGGGGVNLKTGGTWHYEMNKIDNEKHEDAIECGYITGCSMLIKGDILKILKGFDEDYFCYYEDADLSIRCKKLGYKLICATKSILWHKVSVSSGGEYSPTSIYYMSRNRILFVKKFNNFTFIPLTFATSSS
jgi:GT2 family glycosyltransferase